jgi:hypothetical protein
MKTKYVIVPLAMVVADGEHLVWIPDYLHTEIRVQRIIMHRP